MKTAHFPTKDLRGLRGVRASVPGKTLEMVLNHLTSLYAGACGARLTIMEGDTTPEQRNWRGFLVGARALVMLESSELIEVDGYNTKRTEHPSCPTRRCAEERILGKLRNINELTPIEYVVALVVVGAFQYDDTSKHECSTLHPCGSCRRQLTLNDFMRDNTLIITAQPPDDRGLPLFAEINTRSSLLALHDH